MLLFVKKSKFYSVISNLKDEKIEEDEF